MLFPTLYTTQVTIVRRGSKEGHVDAGIKSISEVNSTVVIAKTAAVASVTDAPVLDLHIETKNLDDKTLAPSIATLSRKSDIVVCRRTNQKRSAPCRPSLSNQLASIGAKADDLTREIRQTHGFSSIEMPGLVLRLGLVLGL
jgi:hypothetical protein